MNARGIFGFGVCFALAGAWLAAMFISSDPAQAAATGSFWSYSRRSSV